MKRIGRIPELTTKAKVLLGSVVFVLLAAVATLVVTSIISQQLRSEGETYDFKNLDATARKKDAVKAAQSAANSGDTAKASSVYEQAIRDEPDPAKKVDLAIYQSRTLKLAGKKDEALEVAKKAESYNKDQFKITDWIAQLYESQKRYDEAATYYLKAGGLVDSPTNINKFSKAFYEREAARMKSKG